MSAYQTILDEIETGLASGNVRHRLKLLQRVTDLFVAGSRPYSGAEIAKFDDVLGELATEIEVEARKRLAQRLAALPDSPPKLIRRLAFDDAIAVAAPVLVASPQLSDADLVENAATKSQDAPWLKPSSCRHRNRPVRCLPIADCSLISLAIRSWPW